MGLGITVGPLSFFKESPVEVSEVKKLQLASSLDSFKNALHIDAIL